MDVDASNEAYCSSDAGGFDTCETMGDNNDNDSSAQ